MLKNQIGFIFHVELAYDYGSPQTITALRRRNTDIVWIVYIARLMLTRRKVYLPAIY